MIKKYLNLKNEKMNLQVTRYEIMLVTVGYGFYEEKIAKKFPSIFKLIEVENEPIMEEVVEEFEKEFVEEDGIEVKEINYAKFSYKELKAMIKDRDIEFDGRKSSKNIIAALESDDNRP